MSTADEVRTALARAFTEVERWDLRVHFILMHPEDFDTIAADPSVVDMLCHSLQAPRPEWGGTLRANIWGASVVVTPRVSIGDPQILPDARYVSSIAGHWQRLFEEERTARLTEYQYQEEPEEPVYEQDSENPSVWDRLLQG